MGRAPATMETARLRLRRPRPADASVVFSWASDPEVTRHLDWKTHASAADARAFIDAATAWWESGHEYTWLLTPRDDDVPFGSIACRVRGHAASIGYALARTHWRCGYGSEAAKAVVDWVLALDGIHRVWAVCDVDNAASARVMEKAGLAREGVLRRWAMRPNRPGDVPYDCFVYATIRNV